MGSAAQLRQRVNRQPKTEGKTKQITKIGKVLRSREEMCLFYSFAGTAVALASSVLRPLIRCWDREMSPLMRSVTSGGPAKERECVYASVRSVDGGRQGKSQNCTRFPFPDRSCSWICLCFVRKKVDNKAMGFFVRCSATILRYNFVI